MTNNMNKVTGHIILHKYIIKYMYIYETNPNINKFI